VSQTETLMLRISELKKISFQDPQRAFHEGKAIMEEARESSLIEVEGHALITMALACRSMTKLSECFDYASDALKIFEAIDNRLGISTALNLLGVVYFYYAMFEQALEHFLRALQLLNESDDHITMSRLYNNMGEVYREVENYDEALLNYRKALDLCEVYHYTLNSAIILENMGEVCFRRGDYDQSFDYYEKSHEILKDSQDATALSELENRIGKIHMIRKSYDKARACFAGALERLESLDNKFFSIDVLINFAELERQFNESLFVYYLSRAIQYGEAINARKKLSQVFQLLADYYEGRRDFEYALDYYKRFHRMEQLIETTVIAHKLEIIKIELNKLTSGHEMEKVIKLNEQLEQNITHQGKMLETLEMTNKRLNAQVIHDELTAIPNRRGIQEILTEEWFDYEQGPFYVGLMMMDIDRFKNYNDFHGHLQGDDCLRQIAKVLSDAFGSHKGVVGRFGGEEFTCFAKACDLEELIHLGESFRASVESLGLSYEWQNEVHKVTISVGICSGYNTDFESIQELYGLSDRELYRAKSLGRNCVCHFEKNPI